jgi:DNA-binding CsgD family transcriptional regulator
VLTTFDLDEYAFGALRAGASGFLLKDVRPAELVTAIRTVASGDAVVSPRVTRRLLEEYAQVMPVPAAQLAERYPQLSSLTGREREVLEAVARGLSNAEIAAELCVSETTVKSHVGRILATLTGGQPRDRGPGGLDNLRSLPYPGCPFGALRRRQSRTEREVPHGRRGTRRVRRPHRGHHHQPAARA